MTSIGKPLTRNVTVNSDGIIAKSLEERIVNKFNQLKSDAEADARVFTSVRNVRLQVEQGGDLRQISLVEGNKLYRSAPPTEREKTRATLASFNGSFGRKYLPESIPLMLQGWDQAAKADKK